MFWCGGILWWASGITGPWSVLVGADKPKPGGTRPISKPIGVTTTRNHTDLNIFYSSSLFFASFFVDFLVLRSFRLRSFYFWGIRIQFNGPYFGVRIAIQHSKMKTSAQIYWVLFRVRGPFCLNGRSRPRRRRMSSNWRKRVSLSNHLDSYWISLSLCAGCSFFLLYLFFNSFNIIIFFFVATNGMPLEGFSTFSAILRLGCIFFFFFIYLFTGHLVRNFVTYRKSTTIYSNPLNLHPTLAFNRKIKPRLDLYPTQHGWISLPKWTPA